MAGRPAHACHWQADIRSSGRRRDDWPHCEAKLTCVSTIIWLVFNGKSAEAKSDLKNSRVDVMRVGPLAV